MGLVEFMKGRCEAIITKWEQIPTSSSIVKFGKIAPLGSCFIFMLISIKKLIIFNYFYWYLKFYLQEEIHFYWSEIKFPRYRFLKRLKPICTRKIFDQVFIGKNCSHTVTNKNQLVYNIHLPQEIVGFTLKIIVSNRKPH